MTPSAPSELDIAHLLSRQATFVRMGQIERLLSLYAPDPNLSVIEQFFRRIVDLGVSNFRFDLREVLTRDDGRVTALAESMFSLSGHGEQCYIWSFTFGPDGLAYGARFACALNPDDIVSLARVDLESRSRSTSDRLRGIAGLARDPHSVVEYARASETRFRFLLANSALSAATIVANMMSERTARIALSIAEGDERSLLRKLMAFHIQQVSHLENHPDPELSNVTFNGAKYPTVDEMVGHLRADGRLYGVCGALAFLNMAVLRLAGAPPDRLLQISLMSEYAIHEIVLWLGDQGNYIFDNGFFREWGHDRFYEMSDVFRVANDWIWADRNCSNLSSGLDRLIDEFATAYRQFSFPEFVTRGPMTSPPFKDLTVRTVADPIRLSNLIREEVFWRSLCCPSSHYTFAKYVNHSLLVTYPEAYAIRSITSAAVQKALARFGDVDTLCAWTRDYASKPSLLPESDRIMTADQVLTCGTSDAKSRALLLWTYFRLACVRATLVLSDQGGYVFQYGSTPASGLKTLWDGETMSPVDAMSGRFVLAMTEHGAVYPEFGRDDLDGADWT